MHLRLFYPDHSDCFLLLASVGYKGETPESVVVSSFGVVELDLACFGELEALSVKLVI